MRAAVVHEHGGLDRIVLEEDWPEPDPEPGWVQLRVTATSLNYHDLFSRRGMPGIRLPLPLVIGSDIAGEVARLGEGVEGIALGDRVLVDPLLPSLGMIGERWDGGRAELCVAHASQLVPIPAGVPDEVAAAIPLAYATAHRMMVTRAKVNARDTVLVLGASGGVGMACLLLAKLAGATVLACASSAEKRERLTALGADHTLDSTGAELREAVWEIVGKPRVTGTGGVDLVVNSTGGGTWNDSTRCMKAGGRLVTCGATAGFEETLDLRYVWTFEHSLLGSNGWRRGDITTMLEHAASGALVPVIDRVVPLDEIREAERRMEDREVFGKIVVRPS